MSRYVLGIDLGTTNTALAYVDRQSGRWATRLRVFDVPQMIEPFQFRPRPLLPSFIYMAGAHDLPPGALDLPFGDPRPDTVGELARSQGARVPGRLVSSSKSWLCHDRVDRRAPILPWHGAPDAPRISPTQAAARILFHLREAWDHTVARGDERKAFAKQDVIITVPASFDAVARELTVEAAKLIGIARPMLVEEPQAALYAWVAAHEDTLAARLPVGSRVLVVDVGGGTTDFTVVTVEPGEGGEDLRLVRAAVSDHLLLGGDNMDLALARLAARRLAAPSGDGGATAAAEPLGAMDWQMLRHAARDAKERVLDAAGPERASVVLPGRGTRLIGGARSAELERGEVEAAVLDGFFPLIDLADTRPRAAQADAALAEIGLPFAADPAVTRHLGAFLRRHAPPGEALLRPTHVLFNGGVMKPPRLRERVREQLARWCGHAVPELDSVGLDLAVARGAAYYGLVRLERGIRIWSHQARGYYVGVDAGGGKVAALCLIPRGLPPEQEVRVDAGLVLKANVPIQLPLFASSVRADPAGALVRDPRIETDREEGELRALPPLFTVLRAGKRRASEEKEIPVALTARASELGVIELHCVAKDGTERRWALELQVRAEVEVDGDKKKEPPPLSDAQRERVAALLAEAFAGEPGPHGPLPGLARRLEEALGQEREAWPIPICRAVFELVLPHKEARRRSADHEARLLNLLAFCLRPGFGALLDDHRAQALWKLALDGLVHDKADATRLEWWIFHRRIAGGLTRGQQEQLQGRLKEPLLGRGKRLGRQEVAELWKLAASLEWWSRDTKERYGNALLALLERGEGPPQWGYWALGRLGARVPLYGGLHETVAAPTAARWLGRALELLPLAHQDERERGLHALVQLGRVTLDPGRDLDATLRASAADALSALGASPDLVRPLREHCPTAPHEQRLILGDSVPTGFRIAGAA